MSDGSVTIDAILNSENFKKGLGTLGRLAKAGLKGVVTATATVTAGFVALTKASLDSYAQLEQNIGGIQTLFKNSSDTVIKNANNAYKTAGMSANQYMQTVTGFSASLLQSLSGDTEKASKTADMALIDMADNANKMGTSMESIQNAYQGFAKQNYTMLDNLKLGYGGTKTEMERLLKDAEKFSGVKYDINNLNDVFNAIHIIQQELDITGTTAKEAESTISGSIASLKASWDNFLNGSGNIESVVEMVENVINNVLNATSTLMPRIISSLAEGMPLLLETGGKLLQSIITGITENSESLINTTFQIISMLANGLISNLPQLLQIGIQILQSILNGISSNLPEIVNQAISIVQMLIQTFIQMLPQLLEMGITMLAELIKGIASMLPELIPMAVNCIINLVETLLDNIDQIIDAGIELILGLIDGIIEAIPILIEKAPEIIQKLYDALIRNFPKIVSAGGELLGKLVTGIIGSIYKLVQVAPQLIANIVSGLSRGWSELKNMGSYLLEGFINGINSMKDWLINKAVEMVQGLIDSIKNILGIHSPSTIFEGIGNNLVQGLWNGISGMANWVTNKVKGFASSILSSMKKTLGIHSPSKVFRDEVGKFMAMGVGEGFSDNISKVYKKMKATVDFETQKLSTNLTTNANIEVQRNSNLQTRLESIDNNKEIIVNSTTNLDGKVLAKAINKVNAREKLQYGIA